MDLQGRFCCRLATLLVAAICIQSFTATCAGADDDLQAALSRIAQLEAQVETLLPTDSSDGASTAVPTLSWAEGPATVPRVRYQPPASQWEISSGVLYWKLHQRGLDFAISEDGSALGLGAGSVHNLDFDRDVGFHLNVGYRASTRWAVKLGYTNFETDGLAYAVRPEGNGQLFATRSQPDGLEESETARASATFDYDAIDFGLQRPVINNGHSLVEVLGGFRWIDVQQSLAFDYDGRDFTNGRIMDRTEMDGFGLRFGGQGTLRISEHFSVFGGFAGTILYGRYESRFIEDDVDGTDLIVDLRDKYDQSVAGLDGHAGLAWSWNLLSVTAGYEMVQWFNLIDRALLVDDLQEATFAPLSQDVLLEGLFVRLEVVR